MADAPAATGFEGLLDQYDALLKAMPSVADDGAPTGKPKIGADGKPMMDDKGMPMMEPEAAPATDNQPPMRKSDDPSMDDEPFGKSFKIQLEDGTEQEVLDGTAMVKALHTRNATLNTRCAALEGALKKSLTNNVALGKTVSEQGALLKALKADVKALGEAPAGRRAVLSVHEKPSTTAPGNAASEGVTGQVFMENMMKAFDAGKVSGHEVGVAETYVNAGLPDRIPSELVARVAAAVRT